MTHALIITVNYKGADATAAFLETAAKLEYFSSVHIIVVENGSCDGSSDHLRPIVARHSNVELLESPLNRGYFGGAKWGLQEYLKRGCTPAWVIVCNNDIVFDDPQFLSKLFQYDPDQTHVIAPAIIARLTNLDCNPFLRKRLTWAHILYYRCCYSNYYVSWLMQLLSPHFRVFRNCFRFFPKKSRAAGRTRIYAAHGSFLIFSRSYFSAGGYIDDGFFLYAEELTVGEICLILGLRIVYDPDLQVWHYGHLATGRTLNRGTFEHTKQALQYVISKYLLAANSGRSIELEEKNLHHLTGVENSDREVESTKATSF